MAHAGEDGEAVADKLGEAFITRVLVGQGAAEPGEYVVVGGALDARLRGRGRRRRGEDNEERVRELVEGVIKQLHAVVVGGASERVHGGTGDGGGAVDCGSHTVERHVKGDVHEVALPGLQRAREVKQRAHAQRRVPSQAAGPGDGLGRRPARGGDRPGPAADEERHRDAGGYKQKDSEEADPKEQPLATRLQIGCVTSGFRRAESAITHPWSLLSSEREQLGNGEERDAEVQAGASEVSKAAARAVGEMSISCSMSWLLLLHPAFPVLKIPICLHYRTLDGIRS
ncbi:hypothetical protein C4D60_Mb06t14450 [Musa balbisiana]|uniref:Uncharacterized protein n=1 Tax=Musa balbisiana TaxID=52838 RepID=A0A4S8IMZ0_MUSBA|nr:hypothetical protein C4D60_Mb06t14450 [Musa balbisiana]